jgi:hypothetical protein
MVMTSQGIAASAAFRHCRAMDDYAFDTDTHVKAVAADEP